MRALLVAAAIASVHTPSYPNGSTAFPVIDAYGGRVVWSDYDAAIGAWRLMERSGGATRAVPVAPRPAPFDVDLGPDGHGGTLAVYSRCTRRLPSGRPTPQLERGMYGCDIHAYSFRTGRETPVRDANSGADEFWPAVWGARIAFERTYKGRVRNHYHLPFLYWRARSGPGRAHRLRLPRSPRSWTRLAREPDMRGRAVVYAFDVVDDLDTYSVIYRSTTGGGLKPVARGAWTAGGDASSLRTVGQPALGAHGVDWLFQDRTRIPYRAAFMRRVAGHGAQTSTPVSLAAAFAHAGRTAYWIDSRAAGDDPASQPGGAFDLIADDAVRYRPVPRSWLPIDPADLKQ
jgi:hypothetical protein